MNSTIEKTDTAYDIIILGSGPAGLQAAIHGARRKARVIVLGRMDKSPANNAHIDNLCCIDAIAPGDDFLENGKRQALKFGADLLSEDVIDIQTNDQAQFVVRLESQAELTGKALIMAMGAKRTRTHVQGEKELLGKGVSYCVDCDGTFFKDQPVLVLGNESAAASGALTLLKIAAKVHLVYQELQVNRNLKQEIAQSGVIEHAGTWLKAIEGAFQVEKALLENGEAIDTQGIFIELGAKGVTELAVKLGIQLDSEQARYIQTDKKQATNLPGVFAAGDICGPPWQVAKAIGEGCIAGLEAAAYAKQK